MVVETPQEDGADKMGGWGETMHGHRVVHVHVCVDACVH